MASNQQTSFERSLELFRRELSDDQIKQMDGVNQKSLNDTIQATQNILGRRNDLCKLTRIQRFLHAMEHVEKLVTIFLNASDFVAFIWGPIKLALMVATTWTDAVRQLIDAYEEIAEALGNLAFFHNLIQSTDHLKLVLEDYFSDILRFHRSVLNVFSRPEWKRVFKWAWGSFRREVKPILESLKRKQALLSDDKLQSHAIFKEVQDSDQYAKDQFSNLQTSLEDIRSTLASEQLQSKTIQAQEMKAYLESRLDVSHSRTDLQLESQDPVLESSGNWIFSDSTFDCWERGNSQDGSVLFLNGSPGSGNIGYTGKSTLAKKIIRRQKWKKASGSPEKSFLAYFFFKHDAADQRTTRSMLQNIIIQLVHADETIMRFAYEKLSTMEATELGDLKKLANDSLTSRLTATLVLDGLDEAIDNEPDISINWCLNELLTRDGRLDVLLSAYPQIRLDMVDAHQKDIERFTKEQAAKIRNRFELTEQEEKSLIAKISTTSQGMFLYVKVVLNNLAMMDSIQEYQDELEAETFPDDLDQAYDRIAQRILKMHGHSRHKTVKRILGWVICAARPLRWREIQSRFCIDAEKETCNIRNLRRDSCKSICSSLVDVTDCDMFPKIESEQVISMVHESATKYLVRNGTVNLLREHTDMALFCCRYLSSPSFTTPMSQDISGDIQWEYFGFLDYAAAHYAVHIQEAGASETSTDSSSNVKAVKAAVVDLENANFREASFTTGSDKTAQDLKSAIQDNVLVVRTSMGLQRERLKTTQSDTIEGPLRHKCHRVQCSKFAVGFSKEAVLKKHLAAHERPFRCPHSDCFAHTVGYATSKRLESHNEAFHHNGTKSKIIFPDRFGAGLTGEWDLYEACNAGNLDEVKRLHCEGADLHDIVRTHVTPLCVAVEAGHAHICRYLVDNGVDPFHFKLKSRIERLPVSRAIKRDRLEILEFFLQNGNGPDDSVLTKNIARAIHANRPAALGVLLDAKQPKDHANMATLVADRIIYLDDSRSSRARVHSSDATLIHAWFQYLKPEFYNQKGVFIALSDSTEYKIWAEMFSNERLFLHDALANRCHSLATFLMDIGSEEYLQLITMRLVSSRDILEALITNTRDINYRNNMGESPLHTTSSGAIRVLLESKSVDLYSRNDNGETVFSAKAGSHDIETLEYLFKADPKLAWTPDESKQGFTPLHHTMKNPKYHRTGFYLPGRALRVIKFLLTCSEAKRVLVAFKARSNDADRKKLRDLARKEMLKEALDIMDLISFNSV
ncbi:hypothetical protein FGADI_12776 [Fusarium gaditjirri]|uniref:NACHT domain-containing protein n=1 Tax=Fusarium gaditjirri TaxID=282569 RepID=A0A8H4SRR2_9HYPO|nr:hypothetical protein FGADI_12776 [Fusarium gaditjirri]